MKSQPSRKQSQKKLQNYLNKKNLLRAAFGLSILLNVAVVVVILLIFDDIRSGKLNFLTDGSLQVSTCNSYFNKANIKNTGSHMVGNVNFVRYYLTPAELKNKCNSLNNNINYQYLVLANDQGAINYYDRLTGFGAYGSALGTHTVDGVTYTVSPPQYQVQIPYDANSGQPVNPQTMGLSY